ACSDRSSYSAPPPPAAPPPSPTRRSSDLSPRHRPPAPPGLGAPPRRGATRRGLRCASWRYLLLRELQGLLPLEAEFLHRKDDFTDRKSTRLNSSHEWTSYAVFCWKRESSK